MHKSDYISRDKTRDSFGLQLQKLKDWYQYIIDPFYEYGTKVTTGIKMRLFVLPTIVFFVSEIKPN